MDIMMEQLNLVRQMIGLLLMIVGFGGSALLIGIFVYKIRKGFKGMQPSEDSVRY